MALRGLRRKGRGESIYLRSSERNRHNTAENIPRKHKQLEEQIRQLNAKIVKLVNKGDAKRISKVPGMAELSASADNLGQLW